MSQFVETKKIPNSCMGTSDEASDFVVKHTRTKCATKKNHSMFTFDFQSNNSEFPQRRAYPLGEVALTSPC